MPDRRPCDRGRAELRTGRATATPDPAGRLRRPRSVACVYDCDVVSLGLLKSPLFVLAVVATPEPPPVDAQFDYQLGGVYDPPAGTDVVSRDWFYGKPLEHGYSICYVNAFQTEDDDDDVDRPDERSNWPAAVVLSDLGDDPSWEGEYLIDLSTESNRNVALEHVAQMVDTCATKGFQAVEYDNLDSWARFDETELADQVPFEMDDAVAYAELLTDYAHSLGLAVGQKNALELGADVSLDVIGFDFAVIEQCGVYDECLDYADVFGDHLVIIEYTNDGFTVACDSVGDQVSVVLRDVLVTAPGSDTYVYDTC